MPRYYQNSVLKKKKKTEHVPEKQQMTSSVMERNALTCSYSFENSCQAEKKENVRFQQNKCSRVA